MAFIEYEKKDPILKAIAERTIYSYNEIKLLFDETKSYDALITVTIKASRSNMSLNETLRFIRQYNRPDMIRPIPLKCAMESIGV